MITGRVRRIWSGVSSVKTAGIQVAGVIAKGVAGLDRVLQILEETFPEAIFRVVGMYLWKNRGLTDGSEKKLMLEEWRVGRRSCGYEPLELQHFGPDDGF